MKIVNAGFEIIDELNGKEILKKIEKIARVCYKSENKITNDSCERIVSNLILSGHEAMLEHYSFSVKFICDRGISHEIVRHRLASFAQESTRFCNYSNDKFNNEITVIKPCFLDENSKAFFIWINACREAEERYFEMLGKGKTPQEARSVLPNSLKTEIVMTANLREWRHFFKLRATGETGKPHPQMLEISVPLLDKIKEKIPIIFDDIKGLEK